MFGNKHQNYELLNLIGYGLAKFDNNFIRQFGFNSKSQFYNFIVSSGLAETVGIVKNRQDLFDPFFDNKRKGWWQKGDAYIHRKLLIDSLFGDLNYSDFSEIVKIYINEKSGENLIHFSKKTPIVLSKFKQLQLTGLEAEMFFLTNYSKIEVFKDGIISDARLLGDGYDFQIQMDSNYSLAEVKGVRESSGAFRLTKNEFLKAKEYKNDYYLIIISNLNQTPKITSICDPINSIDLTKKTIISNQTYYHSSNLKW